jgi:Nucleotidyltransferase of unknown function (DUF6036)
VQIKGFAGSRTLSSSNWRRIFIGKVCPLEIDSRLFGMLAKRPTASRPLSREFASMMPKDLKDLLRAFNEHGVRYLVVGGYAFGVHAEPRATKDLDLLIRSDEGNSAAVYRALNQYGAPLDGLSPRDFMDGSTFQVGQPPARVDILQRIDGVTFDEAWQNRIEGLIDGEVQINVISKADLIRNKLASGREQDVLDVKKLRTPAGTDRT